MGCNFPEILAWDLEKSEAVFTSKHMTSGTPSPAVAAVDRDLHYNLHDTMSGSDEPSSPCRPRDLKRVRSFRGLRDLAEESEPEMPSPPLSPTALEKRPQQPQHLQQQERSRPRLAIVAQVDSRPFMDEVEDAVVLPWLSEHGPGSSSSSESSPSSFEMEPIPMRRRHQSVTTAATSVTSDRRSSTTSNPQALTPPGHGPAESWVDLEPDFADTHAADSGFGTDTGPIGHAYTPTSTLEPAPSISDVASLVQGGLSVPRRRSSLRHPRSPKPPEDYHLITDGAEMPSLDHTRSETPRSPGSPTFNDRSHYTIAPHPRSGQLVDDQVSSVYNPRSLPTPDSGDGEKGSGEYRGSFDLGRKAGSKSPKAVRWNGPADTDVSLDPTVGMAFTSPLRSAPYLGAMAPPIPLPPDVIETLMVSTACFPETMLLCSSLSIETIRAYSRKLRRLNSPENAEARSLLLSTPSPSPASLPPCTQSPTSPHKRWRLASILPRKSSAGLGSHHEGLLHQFRHDRHGQHHHVLRGDLPTNKKPARTHYQGSLVCPDFARFKTVFPGAADYLCDALYAHIAAYNYIVLLCDAAAAAALANMPSAPDHNPRPSFSSSPSFPLRRGSATSSSSGGCGCGNDDSNRRIPKKAAHLLGLQQGAAGSAATPGRPGTAMSTPPRPGTATQASIVRVHATELGVVDLGRTASGAASIASGRHRRALTMGSGSLGNRLTSRRRGREGSTASAPPPSRGGTVPGGGGGSGSNRAQNGPESEATLRSLRDALGRCVVNLITTVKLTTEGSAPTPTSVLGAGSGGSIRGAGGMTKQDDVDPWLVRALCEMVRCCEDAA